MSQLKSDIYNAISICKDDVFKENNLSNSFSLLYPFTTENIHGYLSYFDLKDKSLLTVGSSGDQVLNALTEGCKDITVLDINPYTRYYYYLKASAVSCLSREEYLSFFRYIGYPKYYRENHKAFSMKNYRKIRESLSFLDTNSFEFWESLFQKYRPSVVRRRLFSWDEQSTNVVVDCNSYLEEEQYYDLQKKITSVRPHFIQSDLFQCDFDKSFDTIWLSNIGTYLSRESVKMMVDKMSSCLNEDGKMMISYLYQTTYDMDYKDEWAPIYHLEKTFSILNEYSPTLFSFVGIDGLKNCENDRKDSVLIYTKNNRKK